MPKAEDATAVEATIDPDDYTRRSLPGLTVGQGATAG